VYHDSELFAYVLASASASFYKPEMADQIGGCPASGISTVSSAWYHEEKT
jgi:hypothetical protein